MRIDALCTIGKDREYDLDEKTLLKEMDNCQVESDHHCGRSVLCS